ncbi:hypothetical protein Taro_029759 [Colocasia esculenta]|uniref:Uncharacterized protein n=1 Tax=Colocasia esculenta TaxID=4460 RepID=A0A843VY51_COLES|nr:hypothetical protein [Colocasia esculenta]
MASGWGGCEGGGGVRCGELGRLRGEQGDSEASWFDCSRVTKRGVSALRVRVLIENADSEVGEPPGGAEGRVVSHWQATTVDHPSMQTVLSAAALPSPMVQKGSSGRCMAACTLGHTMHVHRTWRSCRGLKPRLSIMMEWLQEPYKLRGLPYHPN